MHLKPFKSRLLLLLFDVKYLQMEIDTSNSNEQRRSLRLSLDSKFGMALRRSTDANINLDMSNHNLQVQFKDDEDVYHLNVSCKNRRKSPV